MLHIITRFKHDQKAFIQGLSGKSSVIVNITRTVCATSMWPGSQGEWMECAWVNSDDFTIRVSVGCRHHWVSLCTVWPVPSEWLSEQSNKSASDFALSLNIPLWKPFGWFRRPQLWATGDWQLHQDNMPTHISHLLQSFLVKHGITQVTQPLYSPYLVPCKF